MSDDYLYEPFETASGIPMWSCTRKGAGICGYGYTMADALNDYLDKQDELVPVPGRYANLGNPESPPEFIPEDRSNDDE